jgi:hypothetical protein
MRLNVCRSRPVRALIEEPFRQTDVNRHRSYKVHCEFLRLFAKTDYSILID